MDHRTLRRLATAGLAALGLASAAFTVPATASDNTSDRTVTAQNMGQSGNGAWAVSGDGSAEFTEDHGGAAGTGAVALSAVEGPVTMASAQFDGLPIGDLEDLALSTFVAADGPQALPVIELGVGGLRGDNRPFTGRIIWDPALQADGVVEGTWQRWDAVPGRWWTPGFGITDGEACSASSPCPYSELVARMPARTELREHRIIVTPGDTELTTAVVDDLLVDLADDARHALTGARMRGHRYDFELTFAQVVDDDAAVEVPLSVAATGFDPADVTVDLLGSYSHPTMSFRVSDPDGAPVAGLKVNLYRIDTQLSPRQQVATCGLTDEDGIAECLVADEFRPTLRDHALRAATPGLADVYEGASFGFTATWTP